MKINIALFGLLISLFSSCASPKYLPLPSDIDVNEFGSYIKIIPLSLPSTDGELIALDKYKMIILTEEKKTCDTVYFKDIDRFRLRYAKPKHWGGTIPAFIVLPFIHGYFSFISIPIHLIVTISVTSSGESAFEYSDENMTYEKLKMFARFPQGIPPGIDLKSIK
jgi:hypothetical protein